VSLFGIVFYLSMVLMIVSWSCVAWEVYKSHKDGTL